jgi:ankyrin repeat protein
MMKKSFAIGLILFSIVLVILLVPAIGFYRNHFSKSMRLQDAAEAGDLDTVKSLIQQGVPINQTSPFRFGWTPLIGAVFQNQTNVIYYLVESGADVNLAGKDGETPLMWLISRGDEAVPLANYLITHGANLDIKDKNGATVFDYANSQPPKPKLIETLEKARLEHESKSHK